MENTMRSTVVCKTVKTKTLAAIGAVAAAVALPQLFHLCGAVSGLGTALGEAFLPMHIAILMVGLLAGPAAGVAAGAAAPLLSTALTGMPMAAMLPFMVIELAAYGLISGLLAQTKMPTLAKLVIAQVGGRAVRAAAIVGGFYLLDTTVAPAVIWTSIAVGLPGLLLQWVLVPLAVFYIDQKAQHE